MIYFLQDTVTEDIKVGFTTDLRQRTSTHQGAAPRLKRLLGTIPGDITTERILHTQLRERFRHISGEWYEGTPELLRFIDELMDRNPEPPVVFDPDRWLWPGRIPMGALTVITGESGIGKGMLACDIAARVTRGGPWPGDPRFRSRIGSVLFLTDDDISCMLVPRLIAAGADRDRVTICNFRKWEDARGNLSDKLSLILGRTGGPVLLVVDYLLAMDDPKLPHVLADLVANRPSPMACVLIVQAEFNNGRSHGIRKIMSPAATVHIAGRFDDGERSQDHNHFSMVKSDLCDFGRSLPFSIVSQEIEKGIGSARVEWADVPQ